MIADLVYDVGVNNGDDSAYYLSRGYRVVGVEANPFLIPHLQERFASEIAEGRYSLLNLAIGKSTGSVPFHVAAQNRAIWSSLDARPVRARGVETVVVEVPCVRFEGILAEHGVPYYLKIDIEGADHFCLRDLSAEDAPEFVSFEASEGDLAHLSYLYVAGYRR